MASQAFLQIPDLQGPVPPEGRKSLSQFCHHGAFRNLLRLGPGSFCHSCPLQSCALPLPLTPTKQTPCTSHHNTSKAGDEAQAGLLTRPLIPVRRNGRIKGTVSASLSPSTSHVSVHKTKTNPDQSYERVSMRPFSDFQPLLSRQAGRWLEGGC